MMFKPEESRIGAALSLIADTAAKSDAENESLLEPIISALRKLGGKYKTLIFLPLRTARRFEACDLNWIG